MSAFTDRLYASWLKTQHRGPSGRAGYGAPPHAGRREGYPNGQTTPPDTLPTSAHDLAFPGQCCRFAGRVAACQ